jgi:capsular exopolysaccharide synthesis family protein
MGDKNDTQLKNFWEIFKKRKRVFVAIVIIPFILSIFLSFFLIKPIFEVKVSMIIGENGNEAEESYNYNDIIMYQSLIKTYTEIARSEAVAEKAKNKLYNSISAEEVMRSIDIIAQNDTQVLILKIQGNSPENTLKLANAYLDSFIEQSESIFPKGDIKMLDEAKLPREAISPNKKLIILEVNAVGFMIALLIILFLESKDSSIKSEIEIRRSFRLNIIGRIPIFKGKKIYSDPFRRLENSIKFSNLSDKNKIITIASPSAKEGKTLIATKLAEVMAKSGSKVALIDFALRNSNVSNVYSLNNKEGIVDIFTKKINYEDIMYYSGIEGLQIAPIGNLSNNSLYFSDCSITVDFFNWLKEKYEYVIIDTSAILDKSETEIIAKYSDGCILVVALNKTDNEKALLAEETLERLNTNIIGVVINRC